MWKGNVMKRNCLKCRKEFESKNIGNRLCSNCNIKNRNESRIDSEYRQGKRESIKIQT